MTTTTPMTQVEREAWKAWTIFQFLTDHRSLLEPLSYEAMSAKMPDVEYDKLPYVSFFVNGTYSIMLTVHGSDSRNTMLMLRRAIGGKWDKAGSGNRFQLQRRWTPRQAQAARLPGRGADELPFIHIQIDAQREEVCQRVVTGTEVVKHPEVEAQPARIETIEKVEWVCGNLLSDDAA